MRGCSLPSINQGPLVSRSHPDSRPSSASSTGTTYSIVPQVYYDTTSCQQPVRSSIVSGSLDRLPSLKKTVAPRAPAGGPYSERSRFSAKYRRRPRRPSRTADSPFIPPAKEGDCLKCLLKTPHRRCESHKYIRVGGGYRHGYWYIRSLLILLQIQKEKEMVLQRRLGAIQERCVRAIKTYVRSKSGRRVVERIVVVSEEDYAAFREGGGEAVLRKHLTKDEARNLESWDSDEVKAIKTHVRTGSGRLLERLVYVSNDDYKAIAGGKEDATRILEKYANCRGGEQVAGWVAPRMKTVKMQVRTGSGRVVERTALIPEEDHSAMVRGGKSVASIISRCVPLGEGEVVESWASDEPQRAVRTKTRTKSGRLVEKTIYVSAEDYESLTKGGGDPSALLSKYVKPEAGETVESWEKAGSQSMKVIRTRVRTKSGRLLEKQVLLTEEEYREFMETGENPDFLKVFVDLDVGEAIENWDKMSSVYELSDDEETAKAQDQRITDRSDKAFSTVALLGSAEPGGRILGKNDDAYEVITDPLTGKKYKRKVGLKESDVDSGIVSISKGRMGQQGVGSGDTEYSSSGSSYHGGGELGARRKKRPKEGGGRKPHGREKRVRDAQGRVVGHRSAEPTPSSGAKDSSRTAPSDGKGRRVRAKEGRERWKNEEGRRTGGRRKDIADFSDSSTDEGDENSGGMTEEERREYLEEKAERKSERERRRKEKYGENYEAMLAKRQQRDKEKKPTEGGTKTAKKRSQVRSMVTYGKGSKRGLANPIEKTDSRKPGLSSTEWGKDGKGTKKRDGYETDDEDGADPATGKKKKKQRNRGESKMSGYDHYETDSEPEYDADGNLKNVKKASKSKNADEDSSDGDYFAEAADGKPVLKRGTQKIDLGKVAKNDLLKLGIDPSLSRPEIARKLKEKYGNSLAIVSEGGKIGTKRIDEFQSDVETDELADDSDLDVTTVKGTRRVNVMMRRGGEKLTDHVKSLMDSSSLRDNYAKDLDERESCIDFLSHYRLVDSAKIESYARAFAVEDEDLNTIIGVNETRKALEGIPSVNSMTSKQREYVLKVLKIDDATQVTFRMFAVLTALSERVTKMDPLGKHLLEICDLLDIERKMELYRRMFYCNAESDRDPNRVKAESLRVELMAGGLNWKQQSFMMERLKPDDRTEISFLDYICYIPLFMSMHDNICDNPLDMSDSKYDRLLRQPSGSYRQRDMNPLGVALEKDSPYQLRQQARDLLNGKVDPVLLKREKLNLLEKYAKLKNLDNAF